MEEKILIVEDEEKLARFVELELVHEGYRVEKAMDGRDALEMAERGDYGLILLDVMLPGMSGMELLRRLRRTKQTPVIMVTGARRGDGQGDRSGHGRGRLHHQAL